MKCRNTLALLLLLLLLGFSNFEDEDFDEKKERANIKKDIIKDDYQYYGSNNYDEKEKRKLIYYNKLNDSVSAMEGDPTFGYDG